MKTPLVWISLTVLLCFSAFKVGQATESITFDSQFWASLDRSEQLRIVQGMIDGYEAGYEQGRFNALGSAFDAERRSDNAIAAKFFTGPLAKYETKYILVKVQAMQDHPFKQPDIPDFPNTFGTYADEVTDYYANHLDEGGKDPAEVMGCLSTLPSNECHE